MMPTDLTFTWIDAAAFTWFLVAWNGYGWYADHGPGYEKSMSAAMCTVRIQWMRMMLAREMRMVDTNILGNLVSGIGFIASTSIFVIGGLVALLGASDEAMDALRHLPFIEVTSRSTWEMKVLLLLIIFVYAFFKFAWSFRLSNYCSILVGAAPFQPNPEEAERIAHEIAGAHSLVAFHFNRGLRAYFFALAVLGWFAHPLLFIAATALVVWVVYRREFRSRALEAVKAFNQSPSAR